MTVRVIVQAGIRVVKRWGWREFHVGLGKGFGLEPGNVGIRMKVVEVLG